MEIGGTTIIAIVAFGLFAVVIILLFVRRHKNKGGQKTAAGTSPQDLPFGDAAKTNVEHIFNEEFREELRNRGRLHFEKIISENAVFVQQDLRQSTSQINQYMRDEIIRVLQEEFKKYEQSIAEAKQLAIEAINKTIATIDQQRELLKTQLQTQSEAQKARIISDFEGEMANIINHYVLRAIGDQVDLSGQMEYILAELEANKAAIVEDIKKGA